MANGNGYERLDSDSRSGASFVIGLLTGAALGAGLGMLFAPKSGSDLRNQLSEQAGSLANAASEKYRKATEAASGWADRGREAYDKTRDAVSQGADEAQRFVRDTASEIGKQAGEVAKQAASSSGPAGGGRRS
jgi:gas vesicle protein